MVGHKCFLPELTKIFSLQNEKKLSGDKFFLNWQKCSYIHGLLQVAFIFFPFHQTKHTPKKFSFLFSLQSFSSTLFHLQTNTPLRTLSIIANLLLVVSPPTSYISFVILDVITNDKVTDSKVNYDGNYRFKGTKYKFWSISKAIQLPRF